MAKGLPAKYIKQYGVTKKAWREYRKVHPKSTSKTKSKPKKKTRSRSTSKRKVSNVGKNNSKMFRTLGTKGALEDFAWGFGGLTLMGVGNPVALPAIRLIQGVQGHVFNRTGKGRLVYALIDLVDLVIVGQASVQSIFDSIKQLTKVAPL